MKHRFTPAEVLTAIVLLVVIAAIAVPMWNTHQLRVRRQDAMDALRAMQTAQDDYFGNTRDTRTNRSCARTRRQQWAATQSPREGTTSSRCRRATTISPTRPSRARSRK
ncbi:MAG TPA: hypothetical protein VFS58_04700 [Steroidobacteraceae bacterium]|nr:hypothetical protein [Steroidobacteraceae bacterium]